MQRKKGRLSSKAFKVVDMKDQNDRELLGVHGDNNDSGTGREDDCKAIALMH